MLHQMFCLKYFIMFRYIFTAEKFPNNIKTPNILCGVILQLAF